VVTFLLAGRNFPHEELFNCSKWSTMVVIVQFNAAGNRKIFMTYKDMNRLVDRRSLIRGGLALGAATFFAPGVFAEQLARTPATTEGPFYPDKLPLDKDNDLLIVNDSITPAIGEVTHLTGRVLSASGEPIRDALVEIWQVDGKGVYLHSADSGKRPRDSNFQGYGSFTTAKSGEYRFRTVKPVPYPGRTPHIHVKVKQGERELLCTQIFLNGHPQNKTDGVFRGIRDPMDQKLVLVDFEPMKDSKIGELAAKFDIVIGLTPSDRPG
jgi:protocatechuate 3,4-dioxygenase beta subunit